MIRSFFHTQEAFLEGHPTYTSLTFAAGVSQYGAVLYIPRGVQVAEPIDLRTLLSNVDAAITIIVEQSATVSVEYGSIAAHNAPIIQRAIRCFVHENASLTLRYDEAWGDDVCATTDIQIEQQQSSVVHYTHLMSGGARVTQRLSLIASGVGASADIRGKYALTGAGSADMTTLQYHDARHTKSNLLFKSIVRDSACMTHRGTIIITQRGAHTESAQHTHTLLLSDKARAYSVPNIEVSTHEVQCGHGSAIGRLDQEQLWYLQARGLSRIKAEQALIDGFFNHIVRKKNDE